MTAEIPEELKARFAYFKRTALREDVRFFLSHAPSLNPAIRAELTAMLTALESRASTTEDRRRYVMLQVSAGPRCRSR